MLRIIILFDNIAIDIRLCVYIVKFFHFFVLLFTNGTIVAHYMLFVKLVSDVLKICAEK